jgi:radical SAM protein with 4Fe4S-binding SPASM domain
MSLMQQLNRKALSLGVPLSVHLDVTYRCNERCQHCYLEHDGENELTTAETRGFLKQFAGAGVFFLTISGGEPLLRRDCFEIIEFARELKFNVKLKTNALLIREQHARRLRETGVEQVQVSIYSHKPEVHDAITRLPGSLSRSLAGIRLMRAVGLKVTFANVLMKSNARDYPGVQALAAETGSHYTLDPTIAPMLDGDSSVVALRLPPEELRAVFRDQRLVGNVEDFCAPPPPIDDGIREGIPCSAGHTSCYISPWGDLYPCVQFPLRCGNLRQHSFSEIWAGSAQLGELRSIRAKHLSTCSSCSHLGTCTRCPGLAFMEGNMRGPSSADCEKSFLRTGVVTAGMLAGHAVSPLAPPRSGLVQIQPPSSLGTLLSTSP